MTGINHQIAAQIHAWQNIYSGIQNGDQIYNDVLRLIELARADERARLLECAQEPLTDEQVDAALLVWCGGSILDQNRAAYRDFFRAAIKAAHGIGGKA